MSIQRPLRGEALCSGRRPPRGDGVLFFSLEVRPLYFTLFNATRELYRLINVEEISLGQSSARPFPRRLLINRAHGSQVVDAMQQYQCNALISLANALLAHELGHRAGRGIINRDGTGWQTGHQL